MQTKKEHSRIAVTAFISAVFIFMLSLSQLSAEPYVHYHLDGDGTDAGSNGLDLEVNEDQLIWVEGINGQAAFIKAVDDNNPLSMNEMYGSGDWTFEAWVKLDSLDNRSFYYHFFTAGFFIFVYDATSGPAAINFSIPDSDFYFLDKIRYQLPYSFISRWFHIAGVYRDGESIQFFVNGEKIGKKILSYNLDFSQIHSLNIGGYRRPNEITIDEVAIHNEALNPEDFIGMQYNVEYPLYAINGNITDSSSGEGLPGAIVTAEPGGYLVSTDSNGDFTIDLPRDGEFNVTVNKSNYTSASKQGIVVTADNPSALNVALDCLSSSHIIADYHFNGNGEDASVNGYDLAVHDSVTWTDGIRGKAAVLFNTYDMNDPIFTPAFDSGINRPLYPGIGDFTCEALMYFPDVSNTNHPLFYIINRSYAIRTTTSRTGMQQIYVYLSSYDGRIEFKVPLADYYDEWVHIALVYRYKQSLQFYINGELIAEEETDLVPGIYPFVPGMIPEQTLVINASDKYIIDEVRISNIALSPENFLFMETTVEASPSPSEFSITGNYPNPFNPTTTIEFTIPETGDVNLSIYNITGQKIRELVAEEMTAGIHSVMWDGRDEKGMMVSSGIYISSLKSGEHVTAKRMLLLK